MSSKPIQFFNSREEIIEQYSEFLDVNEENISGKRLIPWRRILPLRNNMQRCMDSYSVTGTLCWLEHWWRLACLSDSTYAKNHLAASLEEACFWVAKKIHKLHCSQDENSQLNYMHCSQAQEEKSQLDCFQIARHAARTPQNFSKFKNSLGMQLKTYLQFQVERHVFKVLWRGKEATRFSNWGLLRNVTKKCLKNALKQAAIAEPQISCCMLAWRGFKESYTPTKVRMQLQPPTPAELTVITEYYNLHSYPKAALSSDDIKSSDYICLLLKTCIDAARASTAIPQSVSYDDPNYLEDLDCSNNEHLRPPTPEKSLEQAEHKKERKKLWQEIRAVLIQAITELPKSVQTMLLLEHGLGLNQTDIGKAMCLRQYKVSRELKKYKKCLLNKLAQWSENQLESKLSHEKIDELQGVFNEWLKWYCRSPFNNCLRTILLEELKDEIPLLKRCYGQGLSQVEVANQLDLSETDVNQRLEQVKQHLQARLYNWVKDTHNLLPDDLNSAEKIADFIEKWLTKAKYSNFEI